MFFEEKDILVLKNIRFKDGKLDTSIHGHPVLVIKVEDDCFYYLTITSKPKDNHPNEFYKIYKDYTNRFKKEVNYINLKYVYKSEIKNYSPVGYITDEEFNEIMNELYFYQENIGRDKDYKKIRKFI